MGCKVFCPIAVANRKPPVHYTIRQQPLQNNDLIKLVGVSLSSSIHPVLNEEGFSPNFQSQQLPLWKLDFPQKGISSVPCTVDLLSCRSETITLAVKWPYTEVYRVRVTAVMKDDEETELVRDEPQYVTRDDNGVGLLTTRFNVVPWGLKGNVIWSIHLTPSGDKIQVCTHPIELYAVSPRLPYYLSYHGIPRELLELVVLPIYKKADVRTFSAYMRHVVDTIHTKTGL